MCWPEGLRVAYFLNDVARDAANLSTLQDLDAGEQGVVFQNLDCFHADTSVEVDSGHLPRWKKECEPILHLPGKCTDSTCFHTGQIWDICIWALSIEDEQMAHREGQFCVRVAQQQFHRGSLLRQIRIGATSAATHTALTALTANMRTIKMNVESKQRPCGVRGADRS